MAVAGGWVRKMTHCIKQYNQIRIQKEQGVVNDPFWDRTQFA